jgi:hypothetical protein
MSRGPRLAVVAALAAGAIVAGGLFLWPRGSRPTSCASPLPALSTAAKATLVAYAGRIQYAAERSSDGTRSETWTDSLTGDMREVSLNRNRRATNEVVTIRQGTLERTEWVVYEGRIWSTTEDRLPFLDNGGNEPAAISKVEREGIANGRSVVVGPAVVDGQETLHLRETVHFPPLSPQAPGVPTMFRIDKWDDPLTYLPIRERITQTGSWSVTDETWLPRTPGNLAKLELVVPRGFKHMADQNGASSSLQLTRTSETPAPCRQS